MIVCHTVEQNSRHETQWVACERVLPDLPAQGLGHFLRLATRTTRDSVIWTVQTNLNSVGRHGG